MISGTTSEANQTLTRAGQSLVLLIGAVAGLVIAQGSARAVLLLGMLALPLVLLSPVSRILSVVLGGMLVLGSSAELSDLKMAYLFLATVAVGAILLRLPRLHSMPAYADLRPVFRLSFAFGLFIAVETGFAIYTGTPVALAIRDAAPYLLFSSIPLLALDAGTGVSRSFLGVLLLALGLVATISFTIEWMGRRGFVEFPVARVTLSGSLPAAVFAYTAAAAVWERRRWLWLGLSSFILAMLLGTGNRSIVLILIAPLVAVVVSRGNRLRRLRRLALTGVVMALVVPLLIARLGGAAGFDPELIWDRLATLVRPTSLASDQSFQIRQAHSDSATQVFRSSPLVGSGPGVVFAYVYPLTGERLVSEFTLDTPLVFPAKFGLLGVILLFALVIGYGLLFKRLFQVPTIARAALIGFSVSELARALLLGPSIEDKGFSFGFLLLLAMSVSESSPDRLNRLGFRGGSNP